MCSCVLDPHFVSDVGERSDSTRYNSHILRLHVVRTSACDVSGAEDVAGETTAERGKHCCVDVEVEVVSD